MAPAAKPDMRDLEAIRAALLKINAGRQASPAGKPPRGGGREGVARWMVLLESDGHWPDIDYNDRSTVNWRPAEHLDRILQICRARAGPHAPYAFKKRAADSIRCAVDYWLRRGLLREWWWSTIGEPGRVARIMLLSDRILSQSQWRGGLRILRRAGFTRSGQNLAWEAEIVVYRAVLERKPHLLQKAARHLAGLIVEGFAAGMQPDGAFFQHGPCLYNHGYGAAFAMTMARFAAFFHGTGFAFSANKIRLLCRYILDGSQYLTHGAALDFGALGRQIVLPGKTADYLAEASEIMLQIPTGREADFRCLAARACGRPAPALVGNKYFYRGHIMAHHRPGWYASARMCSRRCYNTDNLSACGQGLLSHYLADGAVCMMSDGNEYAGIFPMWDWRKIPGTTVEMKPQRPGEPRRLGRNAFAGGVSNGAIGLAAFELIRGSLRARKAWMFLPEMVVCLGTGIRCDSAFPVVTTLDQCRSRGGFYADGKPAGASSDAAVCLGKNRVLRHRGAAWVFPVPTRVHVENTVKSGSYQRISDQASGVVVKERVLTAWINHGRRPRAARYAYCIVPGAGAADAAPVRRPAALPVAIWSNNAACQAVAYRGGQALGAVFYQAGRLARGAWRLKPDRPCLILCEKGQDGFWLSAADPLPPSQCVQDGLYPAFVHLPGRRRRLHLEFKSPGMRDAVSLRLHLPFGHEAGAAITVPAP